MTNFSWIARFVLISFCLGRPIVAEENYDKPQVKINTVFKPPNCIRKVEKKDFVRYYYYGMLEDGTYFDSSHSRGHSYDTFVFNGWLIEGMDIGLLGMCVNEHRIITIPPHLAYGESGSPSGSIPANATIIFNTILLDIWNQNDDIKVEIIKEAENCKRKLEIGDFIRYHYNGTLLNSRKFHSSYQERQTYNTYAGKGYLIKGMDKGLLGVCQGEIRRITIPPHMAYGEKGDGKNIPASATVVFDVHVIDFHNPSDPQQKTILKEADSCTRKLVSSDYIRYHYNGTFVDGTKFDSSYERGKTYNTYVGMRRLIPGVDRGLIGVCMGEWLKIVVPPHLGYGEPGIENVIPPSAVLIFDIHVIDFHNPKDEVISEVLKPATQEDSYAAQIGDYIVIAYKLELMDGTFVDESTENDFGIYLGRRLAPPGVEKALFGMRAGEVKKSIIPPHLGYGEFGREGYVPGSAVLLYTFTCKSVHEGVERDALIKWKDQFNGKKLKDVFDAVDVNQNGGVDKKELEELVTNKVQSKKAILPPHLDQETALNNLVNSVFKDDSEISIEIFTKFLRKTSAISEELKNEL